MTDEFAFRRSAPVSIAPVDLEPGDAVEAVGGRYRGSRGVIVALEKVQTPSGREVLVARFDRPRAGESWEFPSMLRKVEA